jgi:hypothetical protein
LNRHRIIRGPVADDRRGMRRTRSVASERRANQRKDRLAGYRRSGDLREPGDEAAERAVCEQDAPDGDASSVGDAWRIAGESACERDSEPTARDECVQPDGRRSS